MQIEESVIWVVDFLQSVLNSGKIKENVLTLKEVILKNDLHKVQVMQLAIEPDNIHLGIYDEAS